MSEAQSPLARPFPVMPPIGGVALRVARAGYKDWGRCDLTYVELAEGTAVAGVFTRNVCCSSEVELGRDRIKQGKARALVVNAGNSNAFTGYRGREAVEAIMAQVSGASGLPSAAGIRQLHRGDRRAPAQGQGQGRASKRLCWLNRAAGRTPPTPSAPPIPLPRAQRRRPVVDGKTVTLTAIIKGSGMIAPDMATMLGYIFTDCAIAPAFLQELLSCGQCPNLQLHHRR
jgi:glutamate N-acetyltransferase/amino-acid N-acetyltransferase